ncbi:hypothetical protein Tco_0772152 [Tanacetum coccineum]|uniref:Uncharacterized protein n=1 Tax=Tanacetum coccineum TaxID=301880 RepID=A0ABQ4ZJ43_9ASTR
MCVCERYDFKCTNLTSTPLQEFYLYYLGKVTPTWVLSTYLRPDSSVPDTELVLYLLQDKLNLRDKSLNLSTFKLSRLFFSLLSSGSSSCWRSYGTQAENPEGNSLSDYSLSDLDMLKVFWLLKYVHDDVDDEMHDAETVETGKDKDEMIVAAEADVEETAEERVDNELAGNKVATTDQAKGITKLPLTTFSESISSGFGNQSLTHSSNISLTGTMKDTTDVEIDSLMDVQIQQETPHIQSPSVLNVLIPVIPEPPVLSPILEIPTETPVTIALSSPPIITTISLEVSELKQVDHSTKFLAFIQSQVPSVVNAYLGTSLGDSLQKRLQSDTVLTKIDRWNESRRRPSVQDQNHGKKTKRRRTKESESSKKASTTKETSKGKAPTKAEDLVHDVDQPQDASEQKIDKTPKYNWFTQPLRPPTLDPEWNTTILPKTLSRPSNQLLKGTCESSIELEYNMEKCFKALTDKLDWNNPKGDRYPFNLTKPLPLKGHPGHLTVVTKYFFNNDLEFLKSSDPEKKYTTSIMKTKVARYKIVGIEDLVPKLWSATKVGYDKDVEKEIKYLGPKRQLWYRSQINKFSKHNVYSTQKILSVISVKVEKLHGYGHLEEIVVRRAGRQKYTFKEGDFINLHLNDIEDMLLLAVQHKLFQLDGSDIVDFTMALRMFTRSLIIKRRVEDVQLGIESYQKKLNLTKPQKTFPGIKVK